MTIEYRMPERLPVPSFATRVVSGAHAMQLTVAGGGVIADKFQAEYFITVAAFDATAILDADGKEIGLSFAAGQNGVSSGSSSIRIDELTGDISRLAGAVVLCRAVYQVSATFNPTMNAGLTVVRNGVVVGLTSGGATTTTFNLTRNERVGNLLYRDLEFVLTGTEQQIRPSVSAAGADAVGPETISYLWHSIEVTAVVDLNSTPGQQALSQAMQRMKANAIEDVAPYAFANTFQAAYRVLVSPFDSTQILDANGNEIGLSFAAGQNGDDVSGTANISIREKTGDISRLAGMTVVLRALYQVSPTFNPAITADVTVVRAGVAVPLSAASAPSTTEYQVLRNERLGNLVYRDEAFVLTGTEEEIRALVLCGGPNAVGTETLIYRQHSFVLLTGAAGSATRSEQALGQAFARMKGAAVDAAVDLALQSSIPYAADTVLAADGSGDTTDFRTAYTGLGAGTAAQPHAVKIEPGTYQHMAAVPGDTSYILPDHLDLIGKIAGRSVVENQQANTVTPADTATKEPIRLWYNNFMRDFTAVGKNVRYTFHADPGSSQPNRTHKFKRVRAIHYGNEGAYNYQVSLGGGGNPSAVWMLDRPFGYGSDAGDIVEFRQGYMQGHQRGFGQHDVADATAPFETLIENSEIALTWTTDQYTYAYWLACLGSGQPNGIQLIGVSTTGDLNINFSSWLSNDPKNQPADPSYQMQVRGYAHAPMVSTMVGVQRALRISSANTGAASSVSLAGSTPALIDALFGQVFTQAGPGGGLSAYVWGWNNVKEMGVGPLGTDLITAIGRRLGNRTGSPWTLSVSFDGGAPISVVFASNHTAQTNATIISACNTTFAGAGTMSEFDILGRQRPTFMNEMRRLMNTTANAIRIWSWCAYDGSINKVRPMLNTDPTTLAAGIAYTNDLYPGALGLIKHAGYYGIGDIILIGAPVLAFGDLLEIDGGQPGWFIKNNASTRPILRYVRADTFARVTPSIAN